MTLTASSGLVKSLREEIRWIDERLRSVLGVSGTPARLRHAMSHSLFSGGKRLRPVLLLWTWDALLQDRRRRPPVDRSVVTSAAAALEMIHTYSLIHDDLPSMDDDVLRRGKPTCHVAFDEGTAILAGDALLTDAFFLLNSLGAEALSAAGMIAHAAGSRGMVGGQQEDLDSEGKDVSLILVNRIHRRKTASLLGAALGAGASLAGLKRDKVEAIRSAGIDLGLAFQGADDILDVVGDSSLLGKTPGKDAKAGKATIVRVKGLEAARIATRRTGTRGMKAFEKLLPAGEHTDMLMELCTLLWRRSC